VTRRILLIVLCWACTAAALADSHHAKPRPQGKASERYKLHLDPPPVAGKTLTLDTVLQSAIESFPAMIAAARRQDAAAGGKLAAEGGFDTSVKLLQRSSVLGAYQNENFDIGFEQPTDIWGATFFGGYRRGVGKYPIYEEKSETGNAGEVRAGVIIPLWRNRTIDRRRANLAQAEINQLIASHDYDVQLLELQRIAAQRYWDWVLAGRRVAIAQDLLNIAEQRDQGLRTRIASGDLPPIEATENQRSILERRERVVAAERLLQQTAIQLSLYLRTPDGEPQLPAPEDLPDHFPEPEVPTRRELTAAIDEALNRRPELKRLEQQRKHAEVERDMARNQRSPGVDLALSGAQDFGPSRTVFDTNFSFVNRTEMYAAITVDLPVQQRVADGNIMTAEANLQRIAADYQLASDRIAAEVKDSRSALEAAAKRLGLARQQLIMARELEDGERTRFEVGDSNLMFVNLRELASGDAAISGADALNAFFKSMADFKYALGEILSPDPHHKQ
jgi:cobalt-zinc-cadmium efflux system outer membrane protein